MFRPLCVGHLQVEIQLTDQLYRMCGRLSGDWVGGKGGGRDLVVSIIVTMTLGLCENTAPYFNHCGIIFIIIIIIVIIVGRDSAVSIATCYGLDSPEFESRCG